MAGRFNPSMPEFEGFCHNGMHGFDGGVQILEATRLLEHDARRFDT
ncbi:MAG: hypothetical protein ACRYG4_27865 [Janthinobacterium lividum]